MSQTRFGALALAVFVVSGCSTPFGLSNLGGETSSLSAADRTFISQAAYGSLAEVELGRWRSSRPPARRSVISAKGW